MHNSQITARSFNVFAFLSCVALAAIVAAQESPTPIASPTVAESPSISPAESVPPSPTPEQTASPPRSVRIRFVPPPMEGTISLGIYDQAGKIVRVLHQNAQLDDFTIGPDALATRWDGKDNEHQDLPAGRYHARGYMVGPLKREDLGEASPGPAGGDGNTVKVRLVRNPLRKDKKTNVELGIGFSSEGTYLKTSNGLPLFKISETPNVMHGGIALTTDNTIDIWEDDSNRIRQFRISNIDQMMAFDCGEIELK